MSKSAILGSCFIVINKYVLNINTTNGVLFIMLPSNQKCSCNSIFIHVLGSCQRTPTISYISQEQIKDIGGTVELECSVQYAQEYPVLWMKVDHSRITQPLPISTGSSLIIPDGRFSLRYDTASSTYTLQVKKTQKHTLENSLKKLYTSRIL